MQQQMYSCYIVTLDKEIFKPHHASTNYTHIVTNIFFSLDKTSYKASYVYFYNDRVLK